MADPCTIARDVDLRSHNTFGVAARARWFVTLRDPAALAEPLARAEFRDLPLLVLGEGSNVLFAGDPEGLVLHPVFDRATVVSEAPHSAVVRVDAGFRWDALVDWTLDRGLCGLENLALIPGHAGAAPIQNIGAYGTELAEFVEAVEAWDRAAGCTVRLQAAECGFGYRDSVFKRDPGRWIVCAVELRLPRDRAPVLGYAGVREELAAMGIDSPTPRDVAAAVRRLRRRKLPDPARIGNAGSFFKNPAVPRAVADALRADHPTLPVYPADSIDARKLSAAWLIEACGWKGHREGDAGIAAQHALVLVNHGAASGRQLLELARRVADSVRARFGIALDPEPRIVGARFRD